MEKPNTLSAHDFYVRLREPHFEGMPLHHLQSELERKGDEIAACTWEGACASMLCGSTEWLALAQGADGAVSLGWDWLLSASGEVLLNPHSVRTNLMLVDEHQQDLGVAHSVAAVLRRLERCGWQKAVLSALQNPR